MAVLGARDARKLPEPSRREMPMSHRELLAREFRNSRDGGSTWLVELVEVRDGERRLVGKLEVAPLIEDDTVFVALYAAGQMKDLALHVGNVVAGESVLGPDDRVPEGEGFALNPDSPQPARRGTPADFDWTR